MSPRPWGASSPNRCRSRYRRGTGTSVQLPIASDAVIICNEEGRILGLPYNCRFFGVDFVGTVLLVGTKGDEFCDMPEADFLMDLWREDKE